MANPVKLRAAVSRIFPHGEGVYEVGLRPEGRVPRFKSGQFLHLTLEDFDPAGGFWPESRVFSIASNYGSEEIVIVYSVKGRYTRRMEGELLAGKAVWLKLPYGEFHIDSGSGRGIVLVAGGTGVSPYVPFIQEISKSPCIASPVRLYYGARRADQFLFLEQIASCARDQSVFAYELFVEDAESAKAVGARSGALDIDSIRAETKSMDDPLYYLSGPPGMIKVFKGRLLEQGVLSEDVRIDEWE